MLALEPPSSRDGLSDQNLARQNLILPSAWESGRGTGPEPCPLLVAVRSDYDRLMKKVLVFAAMLVGLGMLARRFGPKMQNMDWEATAPGGSAGS